MAICDEGTIPRWLRVRTLNIYLFELKCTVIIKHICSRGELKNLFVCDRCVGNPSADLWLIRVIFVHFVVNGLFV